MRSSPLRESVPEHAFIPGGAHFPAWPTLLVVDSDTEMLRTLVCYFEKRGFHVAAATTLADAKGLFHRCKTWSLVIADYHLPDGTGWELSCWMNDQARCAAPMLLMSGSPNCATLCAGADYLAKPFSLEALEQRVRRLLPRPQ
jgi:DNA-binding response OmpR family regulator